MKDRIAPLSLAGVGLLLVTAGILLKQNALFGSISDLSFPYLAGMVGLALLVVAAHCLLFDGMPRDLPILPNAILYVMIVGAANVNIVWDGIQYDFERSDIWLNLSNSAEFSIYYAAFLFVPGWFSKRKAADSSS